MGTTRIPLHELVPGMSDNDPKDGPSLLQAEPAALSETARALRQVLVDTVKGTSRVTLTGPAAVRDALKRRLLQPHTDRWTLYGLGQDRRLVQAAREDGGTRNLMVPGDKLPDPASLPPLPHGGKWLVIWKGSIDTLAIDGVPNRLAKLQREVAVADVIFYDHQDREGEPTLYSVRLGRGARGNTPVGFPNPAALQVAQARRNT